MRLASGTRLGPYEIGAPLGAGGMGEVYRAKDTRLGRPAAVKVLPAEVAADPERLRRFEKEARAASALNHPNIVAIYDVGADGATCWFAMEWVDGKTLRGLLDEGALPVKKLLPIATQIADGLARAHVAGIVHRDLKPENVMVTKDGVVKILDFGLAKLTSAATDGGEGSGIPTETGTSPGTILGTVGYLSPEQAAGQPVDFRSDQFSLGSILYEMATGRRAFQKKTAVDTMAAILNEEPEPPSPTSPEAPAPLRWVVDRCLAKDPEGRYDSTRDLARELRAISAQASGPATAGTMEISSPKKRLARLWLLGGAAAALVVGAIAGRRLWTAREVSSLRFERVTYQKSVIQGARFGPDGESVVYSDWRPGVWAGVYLTRVGSRESRSLELPDSEVISVSSKGEMALMHGTDAGPVLEVAPLGGGRPRELARGVDRADWAPDGKDLAIVRHSGGRVLVEFPVGKVLTEWPRDIQALRVSPRGDRLAFREANGALVLVDRSGKTTRFTIPLEDFSWSATGEEIWFTLLKRGFTEIRAISLDGRERLLTSLPGDFVLNDISPRGRLLLERGEQRWDVVGKFPGDESPHPYMWQDATYPTALSPDGRTILFVEKDPGWKGGVTYKRPTDGSPAITLGDGICRALSPDGKWVVCREEFTGGSLFLMPTGPGARKPLPDGGLELRMGDGIDWLPDGKRIVFSGNAPGRRPRIYVQDVAGGLPIPITPEGVVMRGHMKAVSPDGKVVVGLGPGGFSLYPIEGGEPQAIPGREIEDRPIQWTSDQRALYLHREGEPGKIWLLDLASGRRRLWKEVDLSTIYPEGWPKFTYLLLTPDGESYVYASSWWLADLYVLDGLK